MLTPVYSNCACYEMERTTVTFPLAFLPCRTDCDGEIVRGNDNFFCIKHILFIVKKNTKIEEKIPV